MRFASPEYFYLLLILPALIVFWAFTNWTRTRTLKQFASPELLQKMGLSLNPKLRRIKRAILLLAILFLLLALCRPQWGAKMTKIEQKGLDLIIAIDTSKSMLAQDIKPNRLEKAKYELAKLVDLTQGDRIGVVAFAGTAFTLCPLTLDYSAIKLFLESITTEIVPEPGTCLSDAIKTALENFNPQEPKFKVILLLTDGEDHCKELGRDPVKVSEEAKKQGAVIYTVGIGSSEGAPIPEKDEMGNLEYKRDPSGQYIQSRLDEDTLKQIALVTEGKYYHSIAGELEVEKFYQQIKQMERKKIGEQIQIEYEERFQYFLAAGMILLFISVLIPERKR